MKKILASLLVVGFITGILPMLLVIIISKSLLLQILIIITALIILAKELCF